MWKTSHPPDQPYVDQFNRMVSSVLQAAETLDVMPSELTVLMGLQEYKCARYVTDYRFDVMTRAFHGATIVSVMDGNMFEVMITAAKAANIAREKKLINETIELKRSTDHES